MSTVSKIESLLLVSVRPLSVKELMEKLEIKKKTEIEEAIEQLLAKYNTPESGITLQKIDDKIQMVTSKENSEMISDYLKAEVSGELTPASLETLTVIAYRGPINKSELELIRGVNCSLIIRNLLIRGLIEEKKSSKDLVPVYQITFEFLRYLGLSQARELPDFDKLNSDENLMALLGGQKTEETAQQETVAQANDLAMEAVQTVAEIAEEEKIEPLTEDDEDEYDDDEDDEDDEDDLDDEETLG